MLSRAAISRSFLRHAGQSSSFGAYSHTVTFIAFQHTGQVIQNVSPKPFSALNLRILSLYILLFYSTGAVRSIQAILFLIIK